MVKPDFINESDYQITSNSFGPNPVGHEAYYHSKELDPINGNLKNIKNRTIMVRNKDGIDYLLKFKDNGTKIPIDIKNKSVLKYKYYAPYIIIDKLPPVREKKHYIPKKLEKEVVERQNNKCHLCRERFSEKNPYQIDHYVEWSCGGLTEKDNLRALCKIGCHWAKTISFRKAKFARKIDPNNWLKNKNRINFAEEFVNKVCNRQLKK